MFWLIVCLLSFDGVLTGATIKPNTTQYANVGSDVMMTFPFQTVGSALRCMQNKTILSDNVKINPSFDEQTKRRIYLHENKLEIKNFTEMDVAIYSCINNINTHIVTYGIDVKISIVVQNVTEKNIECTTIVVNGKNSVEEDTDDTSVVNVESDNIRIKVIVAVLVCVFILTLPAALLLYYYRRTARMPIILNQRRLSIPQAIQGEGFVNEIYGNYLQDRPGERQYPASFGRGAREQMPIEISGRLNYIGVDLSPTRGNISRIRGIENRTNYVEINFLAAKVEPLSSSSDSDVDGDDDFMYIAPRLDDIDDI